MMGWWPRRTRGWGGGRVRSVNSSGSDGGRWIICMICCVLEKLPESESPEKRSEIDFVFGRQVTRFSFASRFMKIPRLRSYVFFNNEAPNGGCTFVVNSSRSRVVGVEGSDLPAPSPLSEIASEKFGRRVGTPGVSRSARPAAVLVCD